MNRDIKFHYYSLFRNECSAGAVSLSPARRMCLIDKKNIYMYVYAWGKVYLHRESLHCALSDIAMLLFWDMKPSDCVKLSIIYARKYNCNASQFIVMLSRGRSNISKLANILAISCLDLFLGEPSTEIMLWCKNEIHNYDSIALYNRW